MAGADLGATLETELNQLAGGAAIHPHFEQNSAVAVGPPRPSSIDPCDDPAQVLTGGWGASASPLTQPAGKLDRRARTRDDSQPLQLQSVPQEQNEGDRVAKTAQTATSPAATHGDFVAVKR